MRRVLLFLFPAFLSFVILFGVSPKTILAFPSVLGASVVGEEGVSVDGYQIKDPEEPIAVDTAQPTFSGYTVPNVEILLIIRSEEIKAETLSDAKGFWKHALDNPLEAGQHTLSIQITDNRGKTSKESLVATFIVPEVKGEQIAIPVSDEVPLPKSPTINYLTITIGVLGVLTLLGIVYAFFLRKPR